MNETKDKRPELLAPAGSYEGFLGCISAGADAVYMGGPKYGARAFAKNLTMEEYVCALQTAHLFGRKVYMTVNVLTRQEEMDECIAMVKSLWEKGLDGVIVQDLGVLARLERECPGLSLHASTQMSVTGPLGAELLKRYGVSRIVPARELSLEEMKKIRDTGIEIECFIHGAMCYCYSGKCLFSSFLGGRSGNRGRCAGTCRLPYAVLDEKGKKTGKGETYPLSMKDMCVLDILPELIDAGIDSFKIEGRMKKPEYAAGVTAIYRKYIDRYFEDKKKGRVRPWTVDPRDRKDLLSLYIRTDLSTGYYHERNGRDLVTMGKPGYAGADEKLLEKIKKTYLTERPRLPVKGKAYVFRGKLAALTVSAGGFEACAGTDQPVQEAKSQPLDAETIREKLEKTNDTDFVFKELEVETDGAGFLPVKSLNALRRDALKALTEEILDSRGPVSGKDTEPGKDAVTSAAKDAERTKKACPERCGRQWVYIRVFTKEQLRAAIKKTKGLSNIRIILDGPLLESLDERMSGTKQSKNADLQKEEEKAEEVKGTKGAGEKEDRKAKGKTTAAGDDISPDLSSFYLALAPVFRDSDRVWLEEFYKKFRKKCFGFAAATLEEIEFLDEKEYDGKVMGDPGLYAWNKEASDLIETYTNEEILPLELSGRELEAAFRDRSERKVLEVYGYLPMMVTAGCVRKTTGRCSGREEGFYFLEDRYGKRFPVRTDCRHCHNVIYNSVPLSLHHYMEDRYVKAWGAVLISFTVESGKETERILDLFLPAGSGAGGRERAFAPKDGSYTTGHYKKGAE